MQLAIRMTNDVENFHENHCKTSRKKETGATQNVAETGLIRKVRKSSGQNPVLRITFKKKDHLNIEQKKMSAVKNNKNTGVIYLKICDYFRFSEKIIQKQVRTNRLNSTTTFRI